MTVVVLAVDTVGILESLITVSVEQLQRRSTVRNFKFSSFEHREAGKENVILAAAGNYNPSFDPSPRILHKTIWSENSITSQL